VEEIEQVKCAIPNLQLLMNEKGYLKDSELDAAGIKRDKHPKEYSKLALNRQRAQILNLQKNKLRIKERSTESVLKTTNGSRKVRDEKVKEFKNKQTEELRKFNESLKEEAKKEKKEKILELQEKKKRMKEEEAKQKEAEKEFKKQAIMNSTRLKGVKRRGSVERIASEVKTTQISKRGRLIKLQNSKYNDYI
jgi:hypothetical protein